MVDVLVDRPGELHLEHHTPDRTYRLATVTVAEDGRASPAAGEFEVLRRAPELEAERQQLDRWLAAAAGQGPGPGRPDGRPGRHAGRGGAGHLRLPDASRGHQRPNPAAVPSAA